MRTSWSSWTRRSPSSRPSFRLRAASERSAWPARSATSCSPSSTSPAGTAWIPRPRSSPRMTSSAGASRKWRGASAPRVKRSSRFPSQIWMPSGIGSRPKSTARILRRLRDQFGNAYRSRTVFLSEQLELLRQEDERFLVGMGDDDGLPPFLRERDPLLPRRLERARRAARVRGLGGRVVEKNVAGQEGNAELRRLRSGNGRRRCSRVQEEESPLLHDLEDVVDDARIRRRLRSLMVVDPERSGESRERSENAGANRRVVVFRPERVLLGAAGLGVHRQMNEEVPALLPREPRRLSAVGGVRNDGEREGTFERGEQGPGRRIEADVVDDDREDSSGAVVHGLEIGGQRRNRARGPRRGWPHRRDRWRGTGCRSGRLGATRAGPNEERRTGAETDPEDDEEGSLETSATRATPVGPRLPPGHAAALARTENSTSTLSPRWRIGSRRPAASSGGPWKTRSSGCRPLGHSAFPATVRIFPTASLSDPPLESLTT